MTFSFHHHLRDGDYVVNMVMKAAIEELGLEELTIAATSLGSAHDPIVGYIEQGKVGGDPDLRNPWQNGRGGVRGKLRTPPSSASYGGRPRAIEAGRGPHRHRLRGRPHQRLCGQLPGIGGKEQLSGSLGYAMTDAKIRRPCGGWSLTAWWTFPNFPASVEAIDVDAVVVGGFYRKPEKIAPSPPPASSQNPRDLMMAENVANHRPTPYLR